VHNCNLEKAAEKSELMLNWNPGVGCQFSSVPPLILGSDSTVSNELKLKQFSEQVEKDKPIPQGK